MSPTGVCASEVLSTTNLNMRPTQDLCEIIGRFMVAGEGVVAHWVEYAKGLLLFVMAPGDDRSGEFYVYDRKQGELLVARTARQCLWRLLDHRDAPEDAGVSASGAGGKSLPSDCGGAAGQTRLVICRRRCKERYGGSAASNAGDGGRVRAVVREPPRLHPPVGPAASGIRSSLLLPAAEADGEEVPLTGQDLESHLAGEITIGLYAINPRTQRSKWMAIDADYKEAVEDLLKLQYELGQDGVQAALEQSRRGGHLWIFFSKPVLAKHARRYIHHLASRLSVRVKGSGLTEGIELFPKQDVLEDGQFGNAIRAPLGIHRAANRRYWFYGAAYDLASQMVFLRGLNRVTEAQLEELVAALPRGTEIGIAAATVPSRPWATTLSDYRVH